MVEIESATEVAILTGAVAGITYFVGAVGGTLPPYVAAGLSAIAAGITSFLAASNLAANTAAAASAQTKT